MSSRARRAGLMAWAAFVVLWLTSCGRIDPPESEGALLVATLPDPAAGMLHDGSKREGFVAEFLGGFAATIGQPIKLHQVESFEEMEQLVREGRVHIGAFLNTTPPPPGIVFSKPISATPLWVVGHADTVVPHSLGDLAGREVHTIAASPAEAALSAMPEDQRPKIVSMRQTSQQELLTMVANRHVSLAAVDELQMRVAANFQPDLQPAVKLFGDRKFAFAFPESLAPDLRNKLEEYVDKALADGSVMRMYDSYYGHIQRLSPELVSRYLQDIRSLLPKHREHFLKAQEKTGIDWRLIAALAYQESKWDPLATSYTNVRGMMMLTEDTADMLRVDNRLDPGQSITGGAQYLVYLMDQLPESVQMPDRLWLALAAYNLGMGHLNGARAIARSLNKDPDTWYELKTVLPLLTRPEYYERLKSGRARGGEAVILVENVRNMQDILSRLQPMTIPTLAQNSASAGSTSEFLGSGLRPQATNRSMPPK